MASTAEIAGGAGLSERVVRDHLYRLCADGLCARRGTRWRATPRGSARAGPPASARDVAAVLDLLPSEGHRALARLVLAAVVSRAAHADDGTGGWPSFGLWGPPGTGKTTVPRVLARLLGTPEHEVLRVASDLDRAELLGRRVPDGKGGWRFAPAPALGRRLLALDELDKARAARQDALRLLQGDSALVFEDQRLVVVATVLVTLNAGVDPRVVLPADRLRRMVHVSTAGVSEAACRRAARSLFDDGALPVVDLDRLCVTEGPSAEVARYFEEELPAALVAAARPLYPGRALSLIVPGRMALDAATEAAAAEAVARDYLTCAATWGGVTQASLARLAEASGPGPSARGGGAGARVAPLRLGRRRLSIGTVRDRHLSIGAVGMGVAERMDAAVLCDEPVALAVGGRSDAHDRRAEALVGQGAVEVGVAEGEHGPARANEPVALAVGGRGDAHDRMMEGSGTQRAVEVGAQRVDVTRRAGEPVALAVGGRGHAHDLLAEPVDGHRPVEAGVAQGVDAALCADEPVALRARGAIR